MRIVRTAALGAAVVMAAGVAVATQTAARRPARGSADEVGLVHLGVGARTTHRTRRAARRLRRTDRDARRARVPHHHAQAGRLAPSAAHPQERRADHRQGRRGRGLRQRRVEAGADRIADLLRLDGAAHRPQHGHGAGAVPRRELGGARDQAEEGGGASEPPSALRRPALAIAAALAIAGARRPWRRRKPRRPRRSTTPRPRRSDRPSAISKRRRTSGAPAIKGSTAYDAATQTYTLSAGGTNMWAARDEFQFAWRKMSGDFLIRTHVKFVGAGTDPHRKIGVIIRKGLEADSPYVDATVHGDGLTSLQHRQVAGGPTATIERRHHPRRRHRAEARRPTLHHGRGEVRRADGPHRVLRPGPRARRPRRPVRLLAQPEGEGDGHVHQRPHRRAAQDRLGAVPRLHRQQPRGHGHRDRAPHGAAHVADLDPGAELDQRRQDADLQRQRQAVDVRPRDQGRRGIQHGIGHAQQQRPRAVVRRDDDGHQQRQPGSGRRQPLGGLGAAGDRW